MPPAVAHGHILVALKALHKLEDLQIGHLEMVGQGVSGECLRLVRASS